LRHWAHNRSAIMTSARHRIEISFLRSKVARRIFLLFILCAILPLGALALFSFFQAEAHLKDLSERRLHQASKSTGMTLVERLSFLETDLHLIIESLPTINTVAPATPRLDLGRRIGNRFRNLVVLADDYRILSSLFGVLTVVPQLKGEERLHLDSGGTLVTTSRNMAGEFSVFIARLVDPANPHRGVLLGEISSEYLWGGEGFLSPSTELCVLGPAKEVLFSSLREIVPSSKLEEIIGKGGPSGRFEWSHNDNNYMASYWTLFMRPTFFNSWILIHSEKKDDVLGPLRKFAKTLFLVTLLTFWVVTFSSLNQIRRSMVPVELLRDATEKIKARDFSHRVNIKSNDEFAELGASFNEMTKSMENHIHVMSTINLIGVSLSAEKDEATLLEIILRGAQTVFNADAAALFLLSRDDRLHPSMIHISSFGLWLHGSAAETFPVLAEPEGLDAGAMWASAGATERTMATPDVYAEQDCDFAPLIEFDRRMGYRSQSFLSVPLKNHENEVIGILQLINAQAKDSGQIVAFSDGDRRLAESLASQAAVALTKNRLVHDFRGLFEGLTELICKAIDEKSPYTGGHIRRVVVLTMMLARAASKSTNGAFKNFNLSEDEFYELKIAALLHDCGKITTPVHITDKATKLETLYDRIHLVETRSEIIRREHKIALLEEAIQKLAQGRDEHILSRIESISADHTQQLEEDLAFLRKCNQGTEFMTEGEREEVREIARKYSWVNARREKESLISQDDLYRLTIPSGTLTPEERKIINNHITSTIKLLEALPYPKKLRNIPKYAGTHHERMDGAGYPLRLKRDEIPIQGRMIGIADIFEALTAKDRPYRKANYSPSEALCILGKMAQNGHIDPDLYELFVSEKIYLRYAEEVLDVDGIQGAEIDEALPAGIQYG